MYRDNWNGIGTGDFGFCTLSIDNKEFSQSKSEIRISNSANQIERFKPVIQTQLINSKSVIRIQQSVIQKEQERERLTVCGDDRDSSHELRVFLLLILLILWHRVHVPQLLCQRVPQCPLPTGAWCECVCVCVCVQIQIFSV